MACRCGCFERGRGVDHFLLVDELLGLPHIPHSVPAIAAAFSLIMMAGARMAKRVYTERGAVRELTGER